MLVKLKKKRTREVLDLLNESLGDLVFERDDNDVSIENVNSVKQAY